MNDSKQGVDVVLDSLDSFNSPHCPHGPTLLFERYVDGSLKRFYACSACRDRKNCSFFQWADQPLPKERFEQRQEHMIQLQKPKFSLKEYRKRFLEIWKMPKGKRTFCRQCGLLLLPSEVKSHEDHNCMTGISRLMLRHPTNLLAPLDNNRTNAQYHFSEEAVHFFINTIQRLGFKKVLCIGVPRIHEELCIQKLKKKSKISSLLLDIDHRLEQFFTKQQFCLYNMFNHYFFRGTPSQQTYKAFLQEDEEESSANHGSTLVIMDPPFGGLVHVLSHTLTRIQNDWKQVNPEHCGILPVFWIFPYFFESRIVDYLPTFVMLDYKVTYDNHRVFTNNKKSNKYGSPVRIFTNLSPSHVVLPTPDYRFCEKCARYVYVNNKHCDQCNACTSKDGRQYVHCDECERCVKPSWLHCSQCNKCHLPDYDCQVPRPGCHICGDISHKRKDCPQRHVTNKTQGQKRKFCSESVAARHKKKRK